MAVVSVPNNTEQRTRRGEARRADVLDAELFVLYEEKPCRVEDIPMHELVRRFDNIDRRRPARPRDHALGERPPLGSRPGQSRDRLGAAPHAVRSARVPVEPRDERAVALASASASPTSPATSTPSSRRSRCHKSQLTKLDLESSRDSRARWAGSAATSTPSATRCCASGSEHSASLPACAGAHAVVERAHAVGALLQRVWSCVSAARRLQRVPPSRCQPARTSC